MDKPSRSEELREQYVDSAAALFMDRYAAVLLEDIAAEPVPDVEIPEALDKKCRHLIRKALAKKQRRFLGRTALRAVRAAAVAVVLLFGLAGILFTTVEAIRVPIINFFLAQKEGYLEITGSEAASGTPDFAEKNARLAALLPEGYTLTAQEISGTGNASAVYENQAGNSIVFSAHSYRGTLRFDTEDAVSVEKITVGTREAVLVEKNGYRLQWLEENALYQLTSDALRREEMIDLADQLENSR